MFEVVEESFGNDPDIENTLDQNWLDLAKSNIKEDSQKKSSLLNEFKTKVNADKRSKRFMSDKFLLDDSYLLIYLRAGEWNVDQAMEVLSKFYDLGVNYKKYVERSIPSKLDAVWAAQLNTVSKFRDQFGRRVVLLNLGKWDPSAIPVEDWFASTFVLLEVLTKEVKTQIAGLTIVIDCTGFGWTHIRHLGVNEVRLASAFLAGSFPLWTRRIHFINQPRIFSILMNVVKPFLSENAKDVIVFHEYSLDSLTKEVPKEALPKDLGGSNPFCNKEIVEAAKQMEDHFQELIKIALTL